MATTYLTHYQNGCHGNMLYNSQSTPYCVIIYLLDYIIILPYLHISKIGYSTVMSKCGALIIL